MKSLIKFSSIVISCLILLGCFPCKLGDWSCSEINSELSKNVNKCNSTQQAAARTILGSQYTDKVRTNILNSCIDNTNYKFKTSNWFVILIRLQKVDSYSRIECVWQVHHEVHWNCFVSKVVDTISPQPKIQVLTREPNQWRSLIGSV